MKRFLTIATVTCLFVGCGNKSADESQVKAKKRANDTTVTASQAETSKPNAAQLIVQADQFIAKRDLNNAVLTLNKAIQTEPQNAEAYIKRSAVFAEANLHTRAANDMGIAIQLQPNSIKLRNTRGYFHLMRKDYEKAEADFNAALDLNPAYPQALNNRGLVFIAIGQEVKAASDFKNAIELKPDYIDAHNNLGYISSEMGLYDEAIASFTKALELDPSYINALTNRGRAFAKQKKHAEAIADFSKAIELHPENMQFFAHRSEVYRASGQTELAQADIAHVQWFQKLKALNAQVTGSPQNATGWVARGYHLLEENELEAAHVSFDKALAADPKSAAAHLGKATAFASNQEYSKTIELCSQALKLQTSSEAYSLRGDAYAASNQLDESIADYTSARRIDPEVANVYLKRAQKHEAAGNKQLAKSDRQHAQAIEKKLTQQGLSKYKMSKPRTMKIQQVNHEETVTK